ncbi:MAG: DUF4373 domain-containing protein [Dysgonamonadaceae bacterium]|jgi:hypothetical protein|nr:DUF4373 domain-containing protein [Dysgonamonadaceae bacterium]
MKKDTYYFPHDSNARNDNKIISVRMKYGAEGYGIYFMIIEKLRESADYKCVKDYNIIAFDLRVDASIVKSIVEEFGLFAFTDDGEYIYSETLLRRMNPLDELRDKRSNAGKVGMAKRWESTQLQQTDNTVITQLQQTDNNKSKVNKSKVNIIESSNEDSLSDFTKKPDPESPPLQETPRESNVPSERIDYGKFVEWFNSDTKGAFGLLRLPFGEKRQIAIRARVREHGKAALFEVIKKAYKSDFLRGDNNRGWVATFDWILRPSNFEKILSGNYDDDRAKKETKTETGKTVRYVVD